MIYIYKIFRLVVLAFFITYFIGCAWWGLCYSFRKENDKQNFIDFFGDQFENKNDKGKEDLLKSLIISCYFALATLSTVGYGDFFPISNTERVMAVIVMLGGVAFFSYIMGSFIEILSTEKMG